MSDLTTKVLRAREAGAVKRLHTLPVVGHYDIAQHCYGMLVLFDVLCPMMKEEDMTYGDYEEELDWRMGLVTHILYHDTHERFTGDVPNGLRHLDKVSSSAGHFRELQEVVDNKLGYIQGDLSPHQYNWFKSLDRLEFLLTCYDQRALGNKNIEPCIAYEEKWFATSEIVPSEVRKFVADFEWRRTSNNL